MATTVDFINFTTISASLGVKIDHKLTWKPQIKDLCIEFGGKVRKGMKELPTWILQEICYKGIVFAVTYDKLEKLQIKATKLICKLPTEIKDSEVLRRAQWKPLNYSHQRRLALIMTRLRIVACPIS